MGRFVIRVNCWKPLAIIIKRSILDVTAVLDPPLGSVKHIVGNLQLVFCVLFCILIEILIFACLVPLCQD